MPKSRIYEIAQELNKTNKEVIEFLKEKKVEVKSHMSTLEEKDEKMVRDAFTGKNEGKEEKKEAADRPKKKSNLIQVFRPQNAQTQEGKNFRRNKPQSDRNGQDRPARGNGEGNRSGYQNRDNQNRDGQERRFNGQGRRDNQNRDGQSRDGQERRFNGQGRRDNQNRDGQSRDNQGGRRFDNRNGQNNNRYQGQNNRQDGGNGSRRFDGNRDGQNRDNQGGRRFDNNRNGMNRDNRDRDGRENNGRRNERRDSRPAMNSMDLGLARKPVRDVKNKEKDKEKEREREEKKTQDRRNGQGSNRPNQGRFQKSRLPKALQKPARPQPKEEKKEVVKEITLPEKMTIRELAEKMKMQPAVIVKKLFMEGTMVTVNHEIDFEKAQEIALDYDIIAEQEEKVDVIEELLKEEEEDPKDLVPRPPVVCVMGHVDHGKTSLLDAIRKTNVTDREAGGITQHIGAYVVSIKGQKITFLDTPGHEAFTAMRMRGANSTDIAVLVVAADDGVMPQTVEAINHAKAAGVEIIVAINKVDKPSANIERVKQELSEYELIPEDWGGSTIFVPVSAKTHQGIEELLEMILLTSEVCELKANPKRKARGLVIEAELDKGKGPVATILVQKGTLHVGDFIAAGASSGKVRAMMDDKGRRVKEAGPSTPVEILGLSDVPNAGEVLVATENDKEAKNFAATFISENKNRLLEETKAKMSLDDLFSQIQEGNLKELNLIVKADVQGSVEAVKQSLVKLSNDEVVVKVIHGGVGAINESDVTLASASNAIIIGFNVRPDATAKATAEQEGVDLRLYRVIYQAIEDVEAAMKGMLDPVFEEKVIGHAEVRQIFKASGVGNIAGSYVLDGVFQRGCTVRISREGKQIFEGPLASLKRFKDDVKEVKAGYECGLVFEGFNDIQELDQVEAYIMVEVPR
ncbi:translation initiation factor IF-2 [Fusicatenibacter sp. CLA-AA-H241]|nr:translation initiation factor IF-2 [Oliverpabstia intestinalis]